LIEFRFRPGWHLQTASVFLAPFFICFAQSGDTNLAASLQALRSAIQARDLPSIEQQRKELLRAAPRNREAHGTAGQYLADARYCAAAKEEFEIAMSLGVSEAQQAGSHYLLGQCYERISQVARADAEYRQAVNINPGQEKFHFALISLLASQWETGLGEDAARAALARFPASARIWAAAGLVELKNGSFQSALEDWRHASALQPDLPLVIKLLGRIQMSLSRYDEAVQNFTKAVKLDPSDAQAWFFTGLAYLKVDNDGDRALDAFLRAIELNPSYALARIRYAMYLFAMLRFDEAVVEARRAQQLDPVSSLVNTFAGAAYFLAGRVEDATASWQNVLELDPGYSDASHFLARTHVLQGRYEQGIAELQRALAFNKRQPLLLGGLAHAYALAGQREKAITLVAELKRIEADEPGYAPFGMIWAYAGLDDKDQVFAYLEKAYRERAGRMVWINVDPRLESLRSDPRFNDLVRRMKLPVK